MLWLFSKPFARSRVRDSARGLVRRRDYIELVFVHTDGMYAGGWLIKP